MEINQTLRDGRALQYDEMDQRNQSRMKYIVRSGRKTNFSPWRLGDRKACGGGKGEGSHGGGTP
jgi:hypothetical protein